MKIKILFGLFLAASLDLAMGIFSAIIASMLFKEDLSGIIGSITVIFGLFFSILPDFDIGLEILMKKIATGKHKASFMHFPIFLFSLCAVIAFFSRFYGTIAFLALLGHLIHDVTEEGPGIAVFAPFSKKRFLIHKKNGQWKSILSEKDLAYQYSINALDWLKREYLTLRFKPVFGAVSFTVAAVIASKKIFL